MEQTTVSVNEDVLAKLIDIGIALSRVTRLNDLLKLITHEARKLTNSDGASLFLVEGTFLKFVVSESDSIKPQNTNTASISIFKESMIPISSESIAGYVASTGKIEFVDDAYNIPEKKPYTHSKFFDNQNNYHTQSMLAVPMNESDGTLIGVLQLINHKNAEGNFVPFTKEVLPLVKALASQAAVAVRNAQLRDELKNVHYDTIIRLSSAAEFRDNETAKHVQRVANYSKTIADYLGMSSEDQEMIMIASPMHDIGKLGIPDSILMKPGKLTEKEYEIMQTHTSIGGRIMEGGSSPLIEMCQKVAKFHHEKYDGSGYPDKLAGESIPIVGRIVAVSDVFDAISSKRCYKDAVPFDDVVNIIKKDTGTHFDPACSNAFLRALPIIREIHEDLKDAEDDGEPTREEIIYLGDKP